MRSLTTDELLPSMVEHLLDTEQRSNEIRATSLLAEMLEAGVLDAYTDGDGVTHWSISDERSDLEMLGVGSADDSDVSYGKRSRVQAMVPS